jgi:hypothetical protein
MLATISCRLRAVYLFVQTIYVGDVQKSFHHGAQADQRRRLKSRSCDKKLTGRQASGE